MGNEGFLAAGHQAHGAFGGPGRQGADQLHVQAFRPAAEAAADLGLNHMDAGFVHLQGLGQHQMDVVGHLGGGVHGHGTPLGIIFGDGGVRLGLYLANFGAVIILLHDQIGVFHTGIHVAQLVLHIALDIAGPVFVQIDGAVRHGIFGRVIGGQLLIGEFDQIDGRSCAFHIHSGDAGDRLAPVADPVPCQRIFKAGDG